MVSNVSVKNNKFNALLWLIVISILLAGFIGHYYFAVKSVLLQALLLFAVAGLGLFVAQYTILGQKVKQLCKEAMLESKKVIWPQKKEITQTTMAVLAMVVVVGILLWLMDAILVRLVAWIINYS